MQQRVTAIVVARSGAEFLQRTLAGLDRQTRPPDLLIAVDVGSTDGSRALLAAAGPAQLVAAPDKSSFGQAVAHALQVAAPAKTDNEWLWLLAHDNAPEPAALERLLGAVEIAPSVSVAGPKLMRWDQPDVIAEFGESMTRFGASVPLVEGELDQAQHDVQNDVLAVAASGMLVRRSVWTALGGFDPSLPSMDAALDFSVRARLAGHRVIVVPGARVLSAGGPQHFGRRSVSEGRRATIARSAHLHRRLVYAPVAALPVHWLSLLPLALLRSIVHLVAKRPGSVGGEFAAALSSAFAGPAVLRARRNLRRTKKLGWATIAPLRLSARQAQEYRVLHGDSRTDAPGDSPDYPVERVGFITGGGLWAVLAAALLGVVAFGRLIGADRLIGGGLLPLSENVGRLWSQVGYGWREIGVGFIGAADPFAAVLAVLGTLTFWRPSLSIVLLYLVAMPLATLGAWFLARRVSDRSWIPAVGGLLWGIAPPFLTGLNTGHLGASIAHVLLPWLVLLALGGARSWAAAAGAALLFAAVTASAPILTPVLLAMWVAAVVTRPKRAHRLLGIPIPAAVLFAPLVIEQIGRGNPVGLLADPGIPSDHGTTSGIQLAFGAPLGGSNGWTALFDRLLLPGAAAPLVVAALLLPLGGLALLALFVRGSRRAIPALAVALLGYLTAVFASRIEVSSVGPDPIGIWTGSGLSLLWLGLLGGAIVALDAIGRAATGSAVLLSVASTLLVVPLVGAGLLGTSAVEPGAGRILPAFVDAEAGNRPEIGTLILYPESDDAITATLQRGRGTDLDDQSTLHSTATALSGDDLRLATLAGNLASRSGYDFAPDLDELAIGFVVLVEGRTDDARSTFIRTREALDGNALFSPVSETTTGLLWRHGDESTPSPSSVAGAGNTDTPWGIAVLVTQGVVIGLTVLLAIPTGAPRRRQTARGGPLEKPAKTFEGDPDD